MAHVGMLHNGCNRHKIMLDIGREMKLSWRLAVGGSGDRQITIVLLIRLARRYAKFQHARWLVWPVLAL